MCTIRVAKTKTLISFAVTAKLICVFVFAYAECWFSHEAAQFFQDFDNVRSVPISALSFWLSAEVRHLGTKNNLEKFCCAFSDNNFHFSFL